MKIATTIIISMALAMLVCSTASTQTDRLLQITQRSATYTKMCASYPDRASLVDEKSKTDAANNNAAMKGAFKKSG